MTMLEALLAWLLAGGASVLLLSASGCGHGDGQGGGDVVTVTVPATANPWLAGMPNGTLSWFGDSAPAESPLEVMGLTLQPAVSLFFSATGLVRHGPTDDPLITGDPPDGSADVFTHDFGAENGIADVSAPLNALMGVFLGPDPPHLRPPPAALDFGTASRRDYRSIAPELRQAFFIGDGSTSDEQPQEVVVPAGATRLFLGLMDASQYLNNEGAFSVDVRLR
jgi:hypothetical protein